MRKLIPILFGLSLFGCNSKTKDKKSPIETPSSNQGEVVTEPPVKDITQVAETPKPAITSFEISEGPLQLLENSSGLVNISWSAENIENCQLKNKTSTEEEFVEAKGAIEVSIDESSEFELICKAGEESVSETRKKEVVFYPKVVISDFSIQNPNILVRPGVVGSTLISWDSNAEVCSLKLTEPNTTLELASSGEQKISLGSSSTVTLVCSNPVSQSEVKEEKITVSEEKEGQIFCGGLLVAPESGYQADLYSFIGNNVVSSVKRDTILGRSFLKSSDGYYTVSYENNRYKIKTNDVLDSCDLTVNVKEGLYVITNATISSQSSTCDIPAGTVLDYNSYTMSASEYTVELKTPLENCNVISGSLPVLSFVHIYYYHGYSTVGGRRISWLNNRPVISSFTASTEKIELPEGEKKLVSFTWKSENTDSCLLKEKNTDHEWKVDSVGSHEIEISSSSVLALTCERSGYDPVTEEVSVEITRPLPVVKNVSVNKSKFFIGIDHAPYKFKLSWDSDLASSCILLNSITSEEIEVANKGNYEIEVSETTDISVICFRGELKSVPDVVTIQAVIPEDGEVFRSSDNLLCYPDTNRFIPENVELGIKMGTGGYSQLSQCKKAIAASRNNAVCNWNRSNYAIFSTITGETIGKDGYGFSTFEACQKALEYSRYGIVCTWTGRYQPFSIPKSEGIGKPDRGYSKFDACLQSIESIKNHVLCNWNGSNYAPYNIMTNRTIGEAHYGFTEYKSCKEAIKKSTKGMLCNWNGRGYQPYKIETSEPYGSFSWSSQQKCHDYLNTEI